MQATYSTISVAQTHHFGPNLNKDFICHWWRWQLLIQIRLGQHFYHVNRQLWLLVAVNSSRDIACYSKAFVRFARFQLTSKRAILQAIVGYEKLCNIRESSVCALCIYRADCLCLPLGGWECGSKRTLSEHADNDTGLTCKRTFLCSLSNRTNTNIINIFTRLRTCFYFDTSVTSI